MKLKKITNIKIEIPKNEVLKCLGKTPKTEIHKKINEMIDEQIEEACSLIEPQGEYVDLDIKKVTENEIIFENYKIKSKKLAEHFKNAKKATIIFVTIGEDITEKTGDVVIDAIRDSIGSAAVEEVANILNSNAQKRAKLAGYKTLWRFSCGYGDWKLEYHEELFEFAQPTIVKVLPNGLIKPRKSVSAIIGWVKE